MTNLKLLLKNRNQNLVHVDYAKSIYSIYAAYRLEHKFVVLFPHTLWNCRYRFPSNLWDGDFLWLQLMAFSYVVVAAKITNLQDLIKAFWICIWFATMFVSHCKKKIGILGIGTTNLFYYVIVTFTFFFILVSYSILFFSILFHILFHISFSLLTLISISFLQWLRLSKYFNCKMFTSSQHKTNW